MCYGLAGVTNLKNRSGLIRGEIVRDTFAAKPAQTTVTLYKNLFIKNRCLVRDQN